MDKLKPCPFCGYELPIEEGLCEYADYNEEGDFIDLPSGICCSNCATYVLGGRTDKEAITAWNTRTDDKRIKELTEQLDKVQHESIGWMYAYACILMDEGKDIRKIEVPTILQDFKEQNDE